MSASNFTITTHIIPSQHIREFPSATRTSQEDTLHLHVKQYVPRHPPPTPSLPGITILSAHGNGFPKESHEPLWDELLALSHAAGFTIHGIWIADPTHQGLSYALNEDKLSDDPSWLDHSRDTLHMVNHFRAEMRRPIVGVGHSMGGAQLTHLAVMHPRLLSGLVLLDPVLVPRTIGNANGDGPEGNSLIRLSTYRRDIWPSRAEAAAAMRKGAMFGAWDARAWETFVKYGLRDLPTAVHPEMPADARPGDPPVTLMTPIQQEVHTFKRPLFDALQPDRTYLTDRKNYPDIQLAKGDRVAEPFYRAEPRQIYDELPVLRPSVLFILGGDSFTADEELRDTYLRAGTALGGSGGAAEGKAKRVILDKVGHGVPFEAPRLTAEHAAPFIEEVVAEWKRDEEVWKKRQAKKPVRDHVFPSDEWRRHLGPPLSRKKAPKSQSKI